VWGGGAVGGPGRLRAPLSGEGGREGGGGGGGGGGFVYLGHDATGKPNAVFSSQKPCFSIKSRNPDSEFLPAFL